MTTKSRQSGGHTTKAGEQLPNNTTPAGQVTPEKPTAGQDAAVADVAVEQTLHVGGVPQPAKVDRGMVRAETGLSPEPFTDGEVPTAAFGDDERNGKPVDTSGTDTTLTELPTPTARLLNDGVRADIGTGTGTPAPDVDLPDYPSTTLTRSSSRATPMEPADVRHATEPRMGYPQSSTDPVAAAASIQSATGDNTVGLFDMDGTEVFPSQFFEVPDGLDAGTLMRVRYAVAEKYTVRYVTEPSTRLLFLAGQMVPRQVAETLIALHG